ncbi:MAG: M50 family metallopeptidase [Jatrophihabitans sp.]
MAFNSDVSRIWDSVTATQPAPAAGVVAVCAAIALVAVVWSPLWARGRHLVTITHEGAHGVAALLTGRRLGGIRLHSDTSGLTVSRGRRTGVGMFLTAAAGYPGPALLGLGAAYLLHIGHAVALLWAVLVLLALLLVQIRNWFGLWSVLAAGAVVFAVSWWAAPATQSAFAYAGTWFLLLGSPRPVLELGRSRRRGSGTSDADTLGRLTRTSGGFWVGVFLLLTVTPLVLGAVLITGYRFR